MPLVHDRPAAVRSEAPKEVKPRNKFKPLFWLAFVATILQTGLLFLALFEPGLEYAIAKAPGMPLTSSKYVQTLEVLTGAQVYRHFTAEVLTNGENYYPAEVAAIRGAQRSINIEAYIFSKGRVTQEVVQALTERARAGVKVNLLIDAIGSASYSEDNVRELKQAGGRIAWYHPLRWYTWPRMNNRTHRELTVVDGKLAFIGGAGYADHWRYEDKGHPRWRDTMVRVEGDAVSGLQATFAENWLEAHGEILMGDEYFPFPPGTGVTTGLVVSSSPTSGRSTQARVLFQTLLASAKHKILMTTPYFLPDEGIRGELERAIKERGVRVDIVVPGMKSDHIVTRSSSRRLYGELLLAGARIYEYQPTMIHCKSLVVDGQWAVVGSTNMDPRSFGLNDEVNLAVLDNGMANRIEQDFWQDVSKSHEINYEEWKKRPVYERVTEWFGALIERQQ